MIKVKEVISIVENGCTEPIDCFLDNGMRAIVKTYNNIQSNIVLVNELICYELAVYLKLPMPRSGVCLMDNQVIDDNKILDKLKYGKGFYSERIDKATVLTGSAMLGLVHNKEDIQQCILFDHLIYNKDRNPGNLLISTRTEKVRMYMIDHTHVFNKQTLWDRAQLELCMLDQDYQDTEIIERNREIYNIFFNTINMPIENLLLISEEFRSKIDRYLLESIISKVPEEWELTDSDGYALIEYLLYRLKHLDDMCHLIDKNKGVL